jgi:hypothetical protein
MLNGTKKQIMSIVTRTGRWHSVIGLVDVAAWSGAAKLTENKN